MRGRIYNRDQVYDHEHDFETDEVVLEDNAAIAHRSCRRQPTKTVRQGHRSVEAPQGPVCEAGDGIRHDVKWVNGPSGERQNVESPDEIKGEVETCLNRVEKAWLNGDLDRVFYHDEINNPPEEVEAVEGDCTIHYEGELDW